MVWVETDLIHHLVPIAPAMGSNTFH